MADDARARRLAAIEARMSPNTGADGQQGESTAATGAESGSSTPRGPPRHLPKTWTRPSEQAERERRRELARILQRTIVRDSTYAQAATCVETLLKIATNIQTNSDAKYRTLKGDNGALRGKVFSVPGGRDFLIMMGFHTERREFVETFVLDQSERRSYELAMAADVLRDALPDLQDRVRGTQVSRTSAKADEARRIAQSRRLIEADRELVAERVERERLNRIAREERERREQAEKEAKQEDSGQRHRAEGPAEGNRARAQGGAEGINAGATAGGSLVGEPTGTGPRTLGTATQVAQPPPQPMPRSRPHPMEPPNATEFDIPRRQAHDEDDDEGDSEYDSDEGYWNQHRWGDGQKLSE